MAVHEALDSEKEVCKVIKRVGNIRVLNTPKLQQKATLQSLYKQIERIEAKVRLIDNVIEDEYTPVTDEILDALAQSQLDLAALL
jgi:ribosomal protein L36